jgi:hypothetical protein
MSSALHGRDCLYWYGSLLVASDCPLSELSEDNEESGRGFNSPVPQCGISFGTDLLGAPTWAHQWQDDRGQVIAALARDHRGYLLRFPDLADFRISSDGRRISVSHPESTSIETLRHLLLDQVLPRVLTHTGRLVLHASCVRVQDRVLLFVGETGQGKSCLAASFDAAGYPLLSDDGVVVVPHPDGPRILPTYRSLRLWPDAICELYSQTPQLAPMAHYSSKRRVEFAERCEQQRTPLPVDGIFVLRAGCPPPETPQVTPLTARDGCVELLRQTFQLDVTDRQRTAALFSMVSDLARQVPLFAIDYPRVYTCLPQVHAAILGTCESGQDSFLQSTLRAVPGKES